MINGVEVLKIIEIKPHYLGGTIFGLIVLILGILLVLKCKRIDDKFILSFFPIIFGGMCLCLLLFAYIHKDRFEYNEYQVTISDEVKITEFNEKYEILDIDGEIYTIREKGVTNNEE